MLSGFSYASAAKFVQGIGVKLYTMHWPMILSDWGQALSGNEVSEEALSEALVTLLDLGQQAPDELEGFKYPEPDQPHPASSDTIARKISLAQQQVSGDCPVYAFTHSYGPLADVERRAKACWEASNGQMWVNRYAYLSDEKITALGNLCR